MQIAKFVTYKWILGILSIQQSVGFLLLLCMMFTVSFPVSIQPPTINNSNSPYSQPILNSKKEKEEKNTIQRFISFFKDAKDALVDDAEKCSDGDLSFNNLLKSTDPVFFVNYHKNTELTKSDEFNIKTWCITKRFKILSKFSSLRLYLFHRLKLPC